MGSTLGAQKRWAKKHGISIEEYLKKTEAGLKRCQVCGEWKGKHAFPKDGSRKDGLCVKCRECNAAPLPHKSTVTPAMKAALSERNKGNIFHLGKRHSEETKSRLREIIIKEKRFHGEKNPNWKGGITPQTHKERCSTKYKEWRHEVFSRDQFTCKRCGDNKGGNLHAHHILSWKDHPELRFDVDNGETLCFECHTKEHDIPNSYRKRRSARRTSGDFKRKT